MTRKEQALADVLAAMHLRKPQEEALKSFHDIMNTTEMPLSSMAPVDVASLFKAVYPDWHYEGESTEFTFHLATGVGKTRLIGAVMAYLYNTEESKNFVIISPRAEIIRKFYDVCQPTSKDYLFVDPNFVGWPHIMEADSIVYGGTLLDTVYTGPRIWIL